MFNRATVIQHLAFEHLDGFQPALHRSGLQIDRFLAPNALPATIHQDDLLIVLGGPIGAYESERYPFLATELTLIDRHLAKGGAALGICLGAQLIAHALGARVYPSGSKEIGLAPVSLTKEGATSCLAPFADAPQTLHWHGDTFDLPTGATRLASTALCENQAYAVGTRIVGFQFHPEATGEGFEHWLVGHASELAQADIDPVELRSTVTEARSELTRKADQTISRWLEGVSSRV